jgi:hypothetical protein
MKTLQTIFLALLLSTFSSAYAGDCVKNFDAADCQMKSVQGNVGAQYQFDHIYLYGQGILGDEASFNGSHYSVYSGQAGIYKSPFVMYLKNTKNKYEGMYIYTRHQKSIVLSGQKNSEGYIELMESYKGKVTGRIVLKQEGLDFNGKGFWGEDSKGESFKLVFRDDVDEIKKHPRDGFYEHRHPILMFYAEGSSQELREDKLMIQHFSKEGFLFYLHEVSDNGHQGSLTGLVFYKDDMGIYATEEGCELTFSFDDDKRIVTYVGESLGDNPYACHEFGGMRNSLVGNSFSKVN